MMHLMVLTKITMHFALQLQKQEQNIKVLVFLMSDSVTCALPFQREIMGQYNIGEMLTHIIKYGGEVKLCTSCAETRGVSLIIPGATLGSLVDLTNWVVASDKALTF